MQESLFDFRNADKFYQSGRIFAHQEKWLKAASCYQKAIKLNHPKTAEIYYRLATVLIKLNQLEEAIVTCHNSIKLNPNLFAPYWYLGKSYSQKKQYPEAIINLR